jgi:hypothetical protein
MAGLFSASAFQGDLQLHFAWDLHAPEAAVVESSGIGLATLAFAKSK